MPQCSAICWNNCHQMKHLKVLLVMVLTIHSPPTKQSSDAGLYPSFLHARMHECAGEQFLNTAMQLLLCAGAWDAVSGNAGLATTGEVWWKRR